MARRILEEMAALDYDDVRVDRLGNVIGVIRGNSGGVPVMLNCHMDVVAEGLPERWEHPPFSGRVEGGFLHGRGSMDIKGPLAVQTYAGAALRGIAPGDVFVAHTVFEERGGWGMEDLLARKEVEPAAVVIGEATQGDITTGHRGRAEVEVVLRGVAGHASAPERAKNALDLVPPVLTALQELASSQPVDPVLGAASLAPTAVDILPESRNVIPDEVTVALDWRVLPGSTDETLLARVRQAVEEALPVTPTGMRVDVRMATEVQRSYTGISERRDLFTPGFLMEADDPLVLAAARAVGKRRGKGSASTRPWTFATDGGWSRGVFGIPTLGFAAGEERFAHTNRERWELGEAEWSFNRYPDLILALQKTLA
ncbi:MAG: M20/M25/M40 family metallo-hydrolase [Longimicrobiales bacterium]